jgi:tetratricopeptide (TPR) repeat protein
VFAQRSQDGLAGSDLFYEHVHLTFAGNYLLARTIAPQVEKLLPQKLSGSASQETPWPSLEDCANRLGWNTLELRAALNEILVRVTDPPFTTQLNHEAQVAQLSTRLAAAGPGGASAEMAAALKQCEAASASHADDAVLQQELAALRQSAGDLTGAERAIRRALDLLPGNAEGWANLGLMLVQQKKFEEAGSAFQREFELDSQDVSALQNQAMCLAKENRGDDAVREYRRTLEIKPRFGPAWLGLGQLLEKSGQSMEASNCFHKALMYRMHRGTDLATLARFCASRGWNEAAVTNYLDALKLSPPESTLNYEAAQSLARLGRHREAAQLFGKAADLSPDSGQAQFQCGLELGQSGQSEQAAARFKEAVRLMPDLLEARLNLGIALTKEKLYPAALEQFEQVVQRSPTNALALQYIDSLRRAMSVGHQSVKP